MSRQTSPRFPRRGVVEGALPHTGPSITPDALGSRVSVRRTRSFSRIVLGSALMLALLAGGAPASVALGSTDVHAPRPALAIGHTGRVLSVRDKAELHLVRAVGETLFEEGKATGTLPGTARIRLHLDAARDTATATFTFYLRGGTLSGRGSGKAHGGHGGWESFSASATISGGSGRFAHASGTGTMYGAIERRTDKLTVQDLGRLHF